MAERARALGIMIVGGTGLLGTHLARSLRHRARVTVTYQKNRVPLDGILSLPIDVRDVNGMKRVIYAQRPDWVIYLGGSEDPAWVDANAKLAEKIFTSGPSDVLHASELVGARFLYVSSASVFDGVKGNYNESDNLSPATLIGKLKAGGENYVRGRSTSAIVLRLSRLVGSSHPWRPSLFDQIRSALENGTRLELLHDEYHSWTPVSSAVTAIEALLDHGPKNSLFHFGGLTRMTQYEVGLLFAEKLGYGAKNAQNFLFPKKRQMQKGMPILSEGDKYDCSLNSSALM